MSILKQALNKTWATIKNVLPDIGAVVGVATGLTLCVILAGEITLRTYGSFSGFGPAIAIGISIILAICGMILLLFVLNLWKAKSTTNEHS